MQQNGNSKHIAFIMKGYPRLSETFILNEILLLESQGLKLHIVAMRNPGESKVHAAVSQVQAPVTYIPDYFWRHCIAFWVSFIRCFIKKTGVCGSAFRFAAWQSIKQRDSATIKRFMQAVYWVDRCLPQSGIGYLHAHFSHDPTTMTYFASRLTGLPYSFSAHAKDIYVQDPDFLKLKIAGARFVVTCTGFNATYLEKLAPETVPVFCCYHGINTEFYTPRKAKEAKEVHRILSIGRLVPKKGFKTLIRALDRVRAAGIRYHCTIVGSGPQKQELLNLIAELGLENEITLRPEMSQMELYDFYQNTDLFALACEVLSDGDRDGIPNVIVESMAMEVPVVSTRISGIPECVVDGSTGLLVEQKSTEAFAEAVIKVLRNPALAKTFGKNGRQRVLETFDAFKNVLKIERALRLAMRAENHPPAIKKVRKTNGPLPAERAIGSDVK